MKLKEFEKQISNFDSISTLDLSDKEDVVVHKLYHEAETYLLSHPWCSDIEEAWVGAQWDDILTIFLLKINSNQLDVDEYVWIIIGDIPSAYIDIESATNIKEVLECYIFIMTEWIEAVQKNKAVEECYPVEVSPTQENAIMLEKRLKFIEEKMLSHL